MTEERQWTAGPWGFYSTKADADAPERFQITAPGKTVAIVYFPGSVGPTEIANVTLMRASPRLYEALERMLEKYVRLVNSGDAGFWNPEEEAEVIESRAALAQARGESPPPYAQPQRRGSDGWRNRARSYAQM